MPVGSGNFILRLNAGLPQKILVAMNAGQLDSDRRKVVAVEGTINYVACECRRFNRVPLNLDVAIVTDGAHIGWSGQSG